MKTSLVFLVLAIFGFSSQGQTLKPTLKDDLVPEKVSVLAKYLPVKPGGYQYSFYQLPLEKVNKDLDAFKSELISSWNGQRTGEQEVLAKKDIEFYSRVIMNHLIGLYGMDSLGLVRLSKIITEQKYNPKYDSLARDAQKKVFVKKLDTLERDRYLTAIFASPELNNEVLYKRSMAYRSWIDDYIMYLKKGKYAKDTLFGYNGIPLVKLKIARNEIPSGFIKDHLIYQYTSEAIKRVKNRSAKDQAYQDFMESATEQSYRNEIQALYENDKRISSKAESQLFSYSDAQGKMVSLKDFRGKYVYIDVWATWCIPCRAEMPSLKKLEKDYKGKNIEFVSISVDKMKDKTKWINFVKDNDMGGVQVIADMDFNSDFIKSYNINSIPRFILIDPAGKIVAGDAKRPSDPSLPKELDSLLK